MPSRKDRSLQEKVITEIGGDRRASQRYATDLPLLYTVVKNGVAVGGGAGTTVDMSSGGLSFVSTETLRPGMYVEITMDWPLAVDGQPLELVIAGRVVRSDAHSTAIRKERYEFRTHEKAMWAGAAMASGF